MARLPYHHNHPTHRVFFRREQTERVDLWLEIGSAEERSNGEIVISIDREPLGGFDVREEMIFRLRPWNAGRPEPSDD